MDTHGFLGLASTELRRLCALTNYAKSVVVYFVMRALCVATETELILAQKVTLWDVKQFTPLH